MNIEDFSNGFDVLVHNYANNGSFGIVPLLSFDEYEKSWFLTKAQEEIIVELYSGKNQFGESFEYTEEIRRYLNSLVNTIELSEKLTGYTGLSKSSVFFKLPEDIWFITYESARLKDERLGCLNGTEVTVLPVAQDEYTRIYNNPFRGPSKNRVLRLDIKDDTIEIISEYNVDRYLIRYISEPKPIILVDLDNGLSINNTSVKTECELNPAIHRVILERAVRLALVSRTQLTGNKQE